eukprot:SAG31_NODE_28_length_32713_cov_39.100509_20_plen_169_part_00
MDPWVKWRNLGIFKIWEGVSALEPPVFPLLHNEYVTARQLWNRRSQLAACEAWNRTYRSVTVTEFRNLLNLVIISRMIGWPYKLWRRARSSSRTHGARHDAYETTNGGGAPTVAYRGAVGLRQQHTLYYVLRHYITICLVRAPSRSWLHRGLNVEGGAMSSPKPSGLM